MAGGFRKERNVSEFHTGKGCSLHEITVNDGSCSDPGAGENTNSAACVAGSPLFILCVNACIDVVADGNTAVESVAKMIFDGNILPAEVGCLDEHASFGIDRPGATDSDSCDLFGADAGIV
jgi:hypothetical protein